MLSFTPMTSYDVDGTPLAIVAADFNNDGHLDLATGKTVLLGSANGTFGPAISSPAGFSSKSIAVGDFDNDGNLDLAGVSLSTYPSVSVMFGNGNGNFVSPSYISLGRLATPMSEPVSEPMSVAVGDFNEDHLMDIAVTAAYNSHYPGYCCGGVDTRVQVILAHDDRTFSAPEVAFQSGSLSLGPGVISPLVVTDFNGDDHQDVLVGFDGEYVRILRGDGEGNLASASNTNWSIRQVGGMAVGDVNVDGIADLVAADNADVNVRLGNGAGGFEAPPWGQRYAAGDKPTSVVLGDFDRDGVLDVAAANYDSNDVSILRGRGDGAFLPALHFAVSPTAIADFDGSGVIDGGDLAEWRGDFGVNPDSDADSDGDSDGFDFLAWQRQLGSTSDEVENVGPFMMVAGDFNGDGWLDLATANQLAKSVSILINDQIWQPPPPAVTVNIDNVTSLEGTGTTTTPFTFTVTLSAAANQPVTMSYRTVYGSAQDWPNTPWPEQNDYIAKTGTLSFAPGETTKTITIEVKRDNYVEFDEIFYVDLFDSSSNSLFTSFYGIGTILNDDAPIDPNTLFVYDIRFESQRGGKDWRAVFEIRRDFDADGIGTSSDPVAAGVQVTVTFAGQTYSGTTSAGGIFRTSWQPDLDSGDYYANAVDLALAGFSWDPLGLDLEDDSDGDGLPDGLLRLT